MGWWKHPHDLLGEMSGIECNDRQPPESQQSWRGKPDKPAPGEGREAGLALALMLTPC